MGVFVEHIELNWGFLGGFCKKKRNIETYKGIEKYKGIVIIIILTQEKKLVKLFTLICVNFFLLFTLMGVSNFFSYSHFYMSFF